MKTKPIREFTAGDITKEALLLLGLQGIEAWRQNNSRTVRGRTFKGRKGVPDILGFVKEGKPGAGKLVVVEVKKLGDTVKPDQIEFLNQVSNAGAYAFLAHQQGNEIVIDKWEVKN